MEESTKEINRKRLGAIVFNNEKKRRVLTSLTGKYIMLEILKVKILILLLKEIFRAAWKKEEYVLVDAPLLYETKVLEHICYPVILVHASE